MIEQKKKERQTEQLPLVTLRGLTITPSVRVKIPLSRRSSIEAFRFARDEGNGTLALFCQKNDRQIIPKVEDLHPIGIIATVQKLTESSSKNPQNFGMVRGITRVRLLEIEGTDVPEQMRKAKVEIPSRERRSSIFCAQACSMPEKIRHSLKSPLFLTVFPMTSSKRF